MKEICEVNMQWKNTDACFDFYCPCGGTSTIVDENLGAVEGMTVEDGHGHIDEPYTQEWQCDACGRWWHLPNRLFAASGKFFRDDGKYGCEDDEYCHGGHFPADAPGGPGATRGT